MDFLASGVILIKAINTMGYPIAKLKDYLQLSITINDESIIISCSEERSGGIYAFNINDISPFARVFVCLKQSILLDTSMISDDKLNLCNITQYLSQMPYFLHPNCKQINLVGTMCNASKPIPFTFIVSPKAINIGIIKAYKKDNITKNFINDISGISNPKNEIYTMDLNQEINLKAFVYERQKTYEVKKKYDKGEEGQKDIDTLKKGNITKNITSITPLESTNIKWAFKIVNGSYKADSNARSEAFIKLGEKKPLNITNKDNKSNNPTNTTKDNINKLDSIPDNKSYVVLEHLQGDSITIKLSDIFTSQALESLVGKNIIFFAYDANIGIKADADTNINAYHLYQDNNNPNARIIYQDKITSIELKILKTRFRLEFDGEYLFFYENEREIAKWQARSGIAIDNKANGNEIKPIDRASIPSTDTNKSFYYDSTEQSFLAESDEPYFITIPPNSLIESLKAIKDKSINITNSTNQTIANINNDSFKFAENHNENKNINLAGAFSAFIQTLIKHINATESLMIPLKVKYQKRILIIIERFKQTTESTTARMNIYIDRKRFGEKIQTDNDKKADNKKVDDKKTSKAKPSKKTKQSNTTKTFDILDEEFNATSLPTNNPYAFILERPSPDSIGGTLRLRIPEGRYEIGEWHKDYKTDKKTGKKTEDTSSFKNNTLNLKNDFVGAGRGILIHDGHSPKNSNGCLLIKQKEVKDMNNNVIDNILSKKSYKKIEFTNHIQTNLAKAIFGKKADSINTFVTTHIEIRIKNGF